MNGLRRLISHPIAGPSALGSLVESITCFQTLRPASQLTQLTSFSSAAVSNTHSKTFLNSGPISPSSPVSNLRLVPSSLQATAAAAGSPLLSVCVFERLPVVMPQLPQWEVDYAEWQEKLMSKRLKPVPKEFTDDRKTAEDLAGPSAEARWQPAPLETAADRSGDRTTTRRRLDQRIFLLLKNKTGQWEFPHVSLSDGETTRAAAERALHEALGADGFQPYFVGNAPAGHVALSSGTFFFHRCQLIHGTPSLPGGGQWREVAWAAKDELGDYIKDETTLELLQKML